MQFNLNKSMLSPSLSLSDAKSHLGVDIMTSNSNNNNNNNKTSCHSSSQSVCSSSTTASSSSTSSIKNKLIDSPSPLEQQQQQTLQPIKSLNKNFTNMSSPILPNNKQVKPISNLNESLSSRHLGCPQTPLTNSTDYDLNKRKYLVGLNLFNRLVFFLNSNKC